MTDPTPQKRRWVRLRRDNFIKDRIDVLRQRLGYPDLKKKVVEQKARFAPDVVLIEDAGHGTALIDELRGSGALHAIGIRPQKDKITRLSAQSAKIEGGQLLAPAAKVTWVEDFNAELLGYSTGSGSFRALLEPV